MNVKSAMFGLAAAVMAFAMTPATARADVAAAGERSITTTGATHDATTSHRCGCRRYYVRRYYYRTYVRYYYRPVRIIRVRYFYV